MKISIYFITLISVLLTFSCAGMKPIEKRDRLGRVIIISHYDGDTVKLIEEIQYYGKSHNPSVKVIKKNKGTYDVRYKREEYQYNGNKLTKLLFYGYEKNIKVFTGMIRYYYEKDKISKKEYLSYSRSSNRMFTFGLNQYTYKKGKLLSHRIIEYQYNNQTKRLMQIGQYVVYYNKGVISSMKSWVMDKNSKKIIEKDYKDTKYIVKHAKVIEKLFIKRCNSL